jgi:cytochrome b
MQKIKLWDLPTRLFHWLLVASIAALFATGKIGGNWIIWHGKIGIFVAGLIAFRVTWGFVGSTYARFWQFFPRPSTIRAYLKGTWRGEGHNPLGAFSVFALLFLVSLQTGLGLFSTDEIAFQGPLSQLIATDHSTQIVIGNLTISIALIAEDLAMRITGWHEWLANILLVFAGLHFASIIFYARVKKNNLLIPMITGYKQVEKGESAKGGGTAALIAALLVALAAIFVATGAWIPEPPTETAPSEFSF